MGSPLRLRSLVMLMLLISALAVAPVIAAQGKIDDPGAGKGGPIVEPQSQDIVSLNPILIKDGPSQRAAAFLFPAFVGADPDTGLPKKGAPGAVAKDWTVSDDGMTYTFTIRSDWKWSDGTPITSADLKYAYDAIASGKVDTTLRAPLENVASVEAPDPTTLIIKFKALDCGALFTVAGNIPVVPSKKYKEVYPTFEDMKADNKYNLNPTVTAGQFKFSNFRPGEQVTEVADQSFPDAIAGHIIPQGYIIKYVADQVVGVEQFLNGQITMVPSVPESRQDELKELGKQGKLQYFEAPAGNRQIIYLNIADPQNPKNGLDDSGKPIDQGHHPIFGDKRVRQAFALSIDHDALNKGAFNNHGTAIGSPLIPNTWAYNEAVKPWPFDAARAGKLLDEAGFVDDDNNPETPRVANDKALYAKPGTKLEFTFTTFPGNPSIDAGVVLIQNQLKRSGFKMNLDMIDFGEMVKKLLAQNFDAATVFLGISFNNPGNTLLAHFGPKGDLLNSGLNAGSYYNAEFNDLVQQSQSLKGCDMAARKKMLDRAQEIIHDDVPWYFVNYSMVPVVAQSDLKNFDPKLFGLRWNIDAWFAPAAR